MKPEIMAFAILPWLFILFTYYFEQSNNFNTYTLIIILSFALTTKGSITEWSYCLCYFCIEKN